MITYALIRPLLLLPKKLAVKNWPGSVLLKHIYFQRPWLLWERRQASAPRKGTPASQRAQNGNAGKPARPKRERRPASAPDSEAPQFKPASSTMLPQPPTALPRTTHPSHKRSAASRQHVNNNNNNNHKNNNNTNTTTNNNNNNNNPPTLRRRRIEV